MSSLSKSFTIVIFLMITISCRGSTKKDPDRIYFDKAEDYNNYINAQFERVNTIWNTTLGYMDDSLLVYQHLEQLIQASDSACSNMSKLADFKGDSLYRKAAANYFCYMHNMAQTDFREAINIGLMDNLTDSLYFRFDELGNRIGADKDTCIQRLKATQLKFIELINK